MDKKTFVIAGGSTGVAKHVVSELIGLGHNVVFGDLDVKNELKEKQLLSIYTDVTNLSASNKVGYKHKASSPIVILSSTLN